MSQSVIKKASEIVAANTVKNGAYNWEART